MRVQITIKTEDQAKTLTEIFGEAVTKGQTLTVTTPKQVVGRPCECGCGGKTNGGLWLPGHDAKHKSKLHGLVRNGTDAEKSEALKELKERNWPLPVIRQVVSLEPTA